MTTWIACGGPATTVTGEALESTSASQTWFDLGADLEERGDLDGAINAYAQVAVFDETNFDGDVAIAAIEFERGRAEKAENILLHVIEMDPFHAGANLTLAHLNRNRPRLQPQSWIQPRVTPGSRYHGSENEQYEDEHLVLEWGQATTEGQLHPDSIQRTIREHRLELTSCYPRADERDEGLVGRIVVSFTITATGDVALAEIVETDLDIAAVEDCLTQRIRGIRFPEPSTAGLTRSTITLVSSWL